MENNYYEILEVSPNASVDVIEAAYKRLAKRCHPDLQKETKRAWAEDKMKELNLAYETLRDPLRRKHYDVLLMKTRVQANRGISRDATRRIEIIKAKVEESRKKNINYRFLLGVSLVLLFIISMLAAGIIIHNKRSYTSEQFQINIKETPDTNKEISAEEQIVPEPDVPEGRFTLGSSQAVVRKAMGTPTSTFLYSWSYSASLVYFDKDGKVDGWAKVDKNLKAWMGNKKKNAPPFKAGSSKNEVVAAMGTPTSVIGNIWSFGKSMIYFDESERVENWVEIDKQLRVEK